MTTIEMTKRRRSKSVPVPLPSRDVNGVSMEHCGGKVWRCAAHQSYVTAACECCEPPVPECCKGGK